MSNCRGSGLYMSGRRRLGMEDSEVVGLQEGRTLKWEVSQVGGL